MSHGFPYPYGDPLEFSVYVVIFAENTVSAAAYDLSFNQDANGPFEQARFSGPSGDGLTIDEPGGTSVSLTECVIGFTGNPVLVDEYQYVAIPGWGGATFTIGPHTGQDPDLPQYVTCNFVQHDCAVGPDLYVIVEFDNEARSFGAIKSLYR